MIIKDKQKQDSILSIIERC